MGVAVGTFTFVSAAQQEDVRIVDRCIVPEGCYYFGEQQFGSFHFWRSRLPNSIMHAEPTDTQFIAHAEQTTSDYVEGAPAHISAARG